MSQAATAWRLAAVATLSAVALSAQPAPTPRSGLDWRRLGQPSIDLHLAGPATGPIANVWYSLDGGTLFARTLSGRVFATADFETWTASDAKPPDFPTRPSLSARVPEPQARTVTASGDSRRTWSLGRNLFVSEDNGRTWTNVSGAANESVIGAGQRDIAVNPADPASFAVANQDGVWQTHDGGQSWAGVNDLLPNLPILRIVATRRGAVQVALNDGRILQLNDTRAPWASSPTAASSPLTAETADRAQFSQSLAAEITAVSRSAEYVYAGSADGRVWVSRDRGTTWSSLSQTAIRSPIERFFIDTDAPRAALAVSSGPGARVIRTVNAGAVWDDVTSNLPETPVHAAAADRTTGVAFLATDRGVFTARLDLNSFTPPSAWTQISGGLPAVPARDVSVDSAAGQLFAALDGYGLYTAPIRSGPLRVLNAADFSDRAAAPGSVISVIGGRISGARESDLAYPLLASGDSEAQLQVPFESRASSVSLLVQTGSATTAIPLNIRNVSPAIFIDRDGSPFLVDGDSGLTLDPQSAAHPGDRLELMATGLGRVHPDWPTGVPAPSQNTPAVVANIDAFVDGIPVQVTKSTLAPGYIGYYVVEIQLPAVLNAGPAELYFRADGQESNHVRIVLDAQ